jgi:hypothetical protein
MGQRGTMSNGSGPPLGGRSSRLGHKFWRGGTGALSVTSMMQRGLHKTAEKEGTTSITGEWRLPEQPLRR